LPQIAADYRVSAYFRNHRDLYVNLYVPSTVTWSRAGRQYSLRQTTQYPYESYLRFDMTASSPEDFSVFFRIPQWADGARVTTNGMRDSRSLQAGTFAKVNRKWKTGDRIELDLPLKMRLQAVDQQHPDTIALVSGPLV